GTKNLSSIYAVGMEMSASPMAQVFCAGYQELMQLTRSAEPSHSTARLAADGAGDIEDVALAMRRVIREQVTWLERSLSVLAPTASTAPFIGLVRPVWGDMAAV